MSDAETVNLGSQDEDEYSYSCFIQDGIGAELATAPSPNKYEMIERLEYLISLNRSAAPFAKEPLLLLLLLVHCVSFE